MDNEERLPSADSRFGSLPEEHMDYFADDTAVDSNAVNKNDCAMAASSNVVANKRFEGKAPLKETEPKKSKAFLEADAQRKRKYRKGKKEMEVKLAELESKCKTFEDNNKKLKDENQGLKKGLDGAHTTIEQMGKEMEDLRSENKKLQKVALDTALQMISTNMKSADDETDEILIRQMFVEAKKIPEFQKFLMAFWNEVTAKAEEYAQILNGILVRKLPH